MSQIIKKRKQINWKLLFEEHYPYVRDDHLSLSKFSCIPLRLLPEEPHKFILKVLRLRQNGKRIPKKYEEAVKYSTYIPIDMSQ